MEQLYLKLLQSARRRRCCRDQDRGPEKEEVHFYKVGYEEAARGGASPKSLSTPLHSAASTPNSSEGSGDGEKRERESLCPSSFSSSIVVFDNSSDSATPFGIDAYVSALVYVYNSLLILTAMACKDEPELQHQSCNGRYRSDLQLIIPESCRAIIPLVSAVFGFKLRRGNLCILTENIELIAKRDRIKPPTHTILFKDSSFYIWESKDNHYDNLENDQEVSPSSALLWLHIDKFGHHLVYKTAFTTDILTLFHTSCPCACCGGQRSPDARASSSGGDYFSSEPSLLSLLTAMTEASGKLLQRDFEMIIGFAFDASPLAENQSDKAVTLFISCQDGTLEHLVTNLANNELSFYRSVCFISNINILYLNGRSILGCINEFRKASQSVESSSLCGDLEVYLLAGQSNMAGRGKMPSSTYASTSTSLESSNHSSLKQVHILFDNSFWLQPNKLLPRNANPFYESLNSYISKERSRSPAAFVYKDYGISENSSSGGSGSGDANSDHTPGLYYDPLRAWSPLLANSILHKNVDICKVAGYGPGNSFSDSYFSSSADFKCKKLLGLIPASAGGTSLDEWTSDYISNSNFDRLGFLVSNSNSMYHEVSSNEDTANYYRSYNLMSSCLRSVFKSLSHICYSRCMKGNGHITEPARVDGMLWYQGESDLTATFVSNYFDRLRSVFVDFANYISVLEIFSHIFCQANCFSNDINSSNTSSSSYCNDIMGKQIERANYFISSGTSGSNSLKISSDVSLMFSNELRICQVGITTARFDLKNHLITWREGLRDFLFKPFEGEEGEGKSSSKSRGINCACNFRGISLTYVDAVGLPLQEDRIHLDTIACSLIGDLMYVGIRSLQNLGCSRSNCCSNSSSNSSSINSADSPPPRSYITVDKGFGICYFHFENGNIDSILDSYTSNRKTSKVDGKVVEHLVEAYLAARKTYNERSKNEIEKGVVANNRWIPSIDSKYTYDSHVHGLLTLTTHALDSNKEVNRFSSSNIRKSGLKPKNFVYGEITIESYVTILSMAYSLSKSYQGTSATTSEAASKTVWRVVDLGSGSGVALSAAIIFRILLQTLEPSSLLFEVTGVDLMKSKIEECVETSELFFDKLAKDPSLVTQLSSMVRLIVLEDNFLNISDKWIDSDLVIMTATCFQDDLLHPIYSRCRSLKRGSIVVVVDQTHLHDDSWIAVADSSFTSTSSSPTGGGGGSSSGDGSTPCPPLNSNIISDSSEDRSYKSHFKLVSSCEATSSWGVGCVYFHLKI